MDTLPDDVMVAVLGLLPRRELLKVRSVCRHWRDLSQHPDLWRHCCVHPANTSGWRQALLQAPCVASLCVVDPFKVLGTLPATTSCAAVKFKVFVRCSDAAMAALTIRRQVSFPENYVITTTVVLSESRIVWCGD